MELVAEAAPGGCGPSLRLAHHRRSGRDGSCAVILHAERGAARVAEAPGRCSRGSAGRAAWLQHRPRPRVVPAAAGASLRARARGRTRWRWRIARRLPVGNHLGMEQGERIVAVVRRRCCGSPLAHARRDARDSRVGGRSRPSHGAAWLAGRSLKGRPPRGARVASDPRVARGAARDALDVLVSARAGDHAAASPDASWVGARWCGDTEIRSRIHRVSRPLPSFSFLGNPHVGFNYAPVSSVVGPRQEPRSLDDF